MKKGVVSSEEPVDVLLERTLELVRQDGRDLSLRQLAVLLVCDTASSPQTVRGLARYLNVGKPAITRGVDRLKDAGLVSKTADPVDRRSVCIVVTGAGRKYAAGIMGTVKKRKRSARSKEKS